MSHIKKSLFLLVMIFVSTSSLVMSSQVMAGCSFLYVPCYQWIEEKNKYDCGCQLFYCKGSSKEGACPIPPAGSIKDSLDRIAVLNRLEKSLQY